jgi:hypothetical protein
MAMNIVLRDHQLSTSGWRAALTEIGCQDIASHDQSVDGDPVDTSVVFLHTGSSKIENRFRNWASANSNRNLILIAGGGQVAPSKASFLNRIFACWWKPSDFSSCAIPRVREFVCQIKQGSFLPGLLQPVPTERLWAFRLLCEAYELEKTRPNVQTSWAALLKENDDDVPQKVINAINSNIQELGIEMDEKGGTSIRDMLKIVESEQSPANGDAEKVRTCREALAKLLRIPDDVKQDQTIHAE